MATSFRFIGFFRMETQIGNSGIWQEYIGIEGPS